METFKDAISYCIKEKTGIEPPVIEIPPESAMGDFAVPCFFLAKQFKKSPAQIAAELAPHLSCDHIEKVQAVGPYLNFFIKQCTLAEEVLKSIISTKGFGAGKKNRHRILLEGFQPNTHKAFHIGHIRNALLGESLVRILRFAGNEVEAVSYMGDTGAHIAKWIWYYKKFDNSALPAADFSKWAGELYAKATAKVDKSNEYEQEIHEVHRRLEDGDQELTELWKVTRQRCLDDFFQIFRELDCHIEKEYYESEVDKPGKEMVIDLEKKGILQYSDGAIIADLKEHGLGVMVMLKKNGATLYSTKDIGLAKLKWQNHKFDESLYVVSSEQEHHFRQIFRILQLMGYPGNDKLTHVSYGIVKLKEGKMSSRKGNVILYDEFRDELLSKAKEEVTKRDNVPRDEKAEVARKIAFGAMKYTMLAQDPRKDIVFDMDTSLDFNGDSGPYIQYTYTRISSLMRKYGKNVPKDVEYGKLSSQKEKELLKALMNFPEVAKKAAQELKPNHICNYMFLLCQRFNEFYHSEQVIQEDSKVSDARIVLSCAVQTVLGDCMGLIGMDPVEHM